MHIFFIPLAAGAADSAKILVQLEKVKQKLSAKESFATIATELQQQGIAASAGDVGFITAFSLPYDYENIIYGLTEGSC